MPRDPGFAQTRNENLGLLVLQSMVLGTFHFIP